MNRIKADMLRNMKEKTGNRIHIPAFLRITAILLVLATAAAMFVHPETANSAIRNGQNPGFAVGANKYELGVYYWHSPVSSGGYGNQYCMEWNSPDLGRPVESSSEITDPNARAIAYLAEKHKEDRDDLTQASIAYLVHEYLEVTPESRAWWNAWKNDNIGELNSLGVPARSRELMSEAPANISGARADYSFYSQKGTFSPQITGLDGNYTRGVGFTLTDTNDVIRFDATGTNSISLTTDGTAQQVDWTAVRSGESHVEIVFNSGNGIRHHKTASQDMFDFGNFAARAQGAVNFSVFAPFLPAVSTNVSKHELQRGQTVKDTVTSFVPDGGQWTPSVAVKAKGYYFIGGQDILQRIEKGENETAAEYLRRIESLRGQPVATAEAVFDHAGQTVEAEALKTDTGEPWTNPEDGKFGAWLWTIEKNNQENDVKDRIVSDYADVFGQVAESDVHSVIPSERSEIIEKSTYPGQEITDTIYLKGFPQDFGQFKGKTEGDVYYSADNTELKVRLWWSGESYDGTEVVPWDKLSQYRPDSKEEPAEDEHHKLVGEYEYDIADLIASENVNYNPQVGLTLTVGRSGAKQSNGREAPVIVADKQGYYTFVAQYSACSRAQGFISAYDDVSESTLVREQQRQVDMVTNANPGTANVGEVFRDVAHISGRGTNAQVLEKGAYVTFTAYEPVSGYPDISAGKLLDNVPVYLTDEQIDGLQQGRPADVFSPEVTANKSGYVYWQAVLRDKDSNPIVTGVLGESSETVRIQAGGIVSTSAMKQGAVGEPIWDEITVSDRTVSQGGSVQTGNIPEGSSVTVELFRFDGHPQNNGENKAVAVRTYPVDTSKFASRPGSYTFRAGDDGFFVPNSAGMYYWVATLRDNNGAVLDKGEYGEASERTSVQGYSTQTAKKWLSVPKDAYAAQTVCTYDVMTQNAYDYVSGDHGVEAADTVKGTVYRFELWKQSETGTADNDTKVWQGNEHDMPDIITDADQHHRQGNKIKSENVDISALKCGYGRYYWRVLISSADGKVVYTPPREQSESFDVIDVESESSEPVFTSDMSVADTLIFKGRIPAGTKYFSQLWKVEKDGSLSGPVAQTAEKTIETDRIGTDANPLRIMTEPIAPPEGGWGTGTYQFRFKVFSPDETGGNIDAGIIGEKSEVVADLASVDSRESEDWQQSPHEKAGYAKNELIWDGSDDLKERFNVISISTSAKDCSSAHEYNGEYYVDVTQGADVSDHAFIEGEIPQGYRLGFVLFKQSEDTGHPTAIDQAIAFLDPVVLPASAKEAHSPAVRIEDPGNYYWVWSLQKPDGSNFMPNDIPAAYSRIRIPSESFHASRITTSTYKWNSVGGKLADVARIEGVLPKESSITFSLFDYANDAKIGETESVALSSLGYEGSTPKGYEQIESPSLTVSEQGDYYWVDSVKLPGEKDNFHTGEEHSAPESVHAANVRTDTAVEVIAGTAISDHAVLSGFDIGSQSGNTDSSVKQDICARWTLYRHSGSDEPNDDEQVFPSSEWQKIAPGQTEAVSEPVCVDEVGIYYWVIEVADAADNYRIIAQGNRRDPDETFRTIEAKSHTDSVVKAGEKIYDTVDITGPIAENTRISWRLFEQKGADASQDAQTGEETYRDITAEEAAQALQTGHLSAASPEAVLPDYAGTFYWVFELTAPKRGGGLEEQPFFTDRARTEEETVNTVNVVTQSAEKTAVAPTVIHDIAYIEGSIPDGNYCMEFELWAAVHDNPSGNGQDSEQNSEQSAEKSAGESANDVLVAKTACNAVSPMSDTVQSDGIDVFREADYYWRERLTDMNTGREVCYGLPRVQSESVVVTRPPLPDTGAAKSLFVSGIAAAFFAAGGMYSIVLKVKRYYSSWPAEGKHMRKK